MSCILSEKQDISIFNQVDPATSYIYFTILKEDLPRFHHALGLDALGGSVRLENGMEFGTQEALLILLYKFIYTQSALHADKKFPYGNIFLL